MSGTAAGISNVLGRADVVGIDRITVCVATSKSIRFIERSDADFAQDETSHVFDVSLKCLKELARRVSRRPQVTTVRKRKLLLFSENMLYILMALLRLDLLLMEQASL